MTLTFMQRLLTLKLELIAFWLVVGGWRWSLLPLLGCRIHRDGCCYGVWLFAGGGTLQFMRTTFGIELVSIAKQQPLVTGNVVMTNDSMRSVSILSVSHLCLLVCCDSVVAVTLTPWCEGVTYTYTHTHAHRMVAAIVNRQNGLPPVVKETVAVFDGENKGSWGNNHE